MGISPMRMGVKAPVGLDTYASETNDYIYVPGP